MKVTIICNPVLAKLHEPEKEIRHLVSEILSYEVDGAKHMKIGNWNGFSSFFSMRSNTFPAGFVRMVKRKLELGGHTVHVVRRPAPAPLGPERPVVDSFPDRPEYEYQYECMERLVKLNGMIAQVATGGGKSKIFKLCAARLGLPTLFVTTRKSLMWQMVKNYEDTMGESAGVMGDGVWRPKPKGVNFAIVDTVTSRLEVITVQSEIKKQVETWHAKIEKIIQKKLTAAGLVPENTLVRNLPAAIQDQVNAIRAEIHEKHKLDYDDLERQIVEKVRVQTARRDEMLAFLKGIGFICLEEAHEVSGSGFYDIAQACSNAYYRLALTATPFMKDSAEANMRLMAVTGPIGIKVSEKRLIDSGILAKPYFKYLKSPKPARLGQSSSWDAAYRLGVTENHPRNMAIVSECMKAKEYGLNMMVLIQHKKHGETLRELLTVAGLTVRYIAGEDTQESRDFALKLLGEKKIDVLIGTSILDVGIDVPSVGMIVLAGGGKAEVNLRQRIGRGLRAKKSGPNVAFVVDFEDRFNKHLIKHSTERRRIVEATPGFAENIVAEFDYEGAGFEKVG